MDATVNVKAIAAVLPDPVLGWAAPNTNASGGMDQAAMLATLGGLYDKLVKDVAAHVIATMSEKPVMDPAVTLARTFGDMRRIAEDVFEQKIEGALENYDCSDAVEEALRDHDIDGKVEDAVSEIDFDTKVEEALDNVDLDLKIKDAIKLLQFSLVAR